MGFSRQEYWSGLLFLPPVYLPNPDTEPVSSASPALQVDSLPQDFLGGSQFSSVAQSYQTICNPMNRSNPGLDVHHQLPESTQTCVHQVDDAIQPSHPLSSPSPSALNLFQHQGLFK